MRSKSNFPLSGRLGSAVQHLVHQDAELDQGGGRGQDLQVRPAPPVPDRGDQEVHLGTGPGQPLM